MLGAGFKGEGHAIEIWSLSCHCGLAQGMLLLSTAPFLAFEVMRASLQPQHAGDASRATGSH